MSDRDRTPEELVQDRVGVDLAKAVSVDKLDVGSQGQAAANESGRPSATAHEVAEQTRRGQQDRPDGRQDRDEKLTNMGRGHQTHG